MVAWISAAVVEVLGIVYIIAKYLFEDNEAGPAGSDEASEP